MYSKNIVLSLYRNILSNMKKNGWKPQYLNTESNIINSEIKKYSFNSKQNINFYCTAQVPRTIKERPDLHAFGINLKEMIQRRHYNDSTLTGLILLDNEIKFNKDFFKNN